MEKKTFLDIENAITKRLWAAWRPIAAKLYADVQASIDKGDFADAYDKAKSLDLTDVGTVNKEWIKFHLLSAAIFGAKMANPGKAVAVATSGHDSVMTQVTDTFLKAIEYNATTDVYKRLVQLIANAEEAAKTVKKDDDEDTASSNRFVKEYVDFRKSGDSALQLQSSLNTSRLAVWGFTGEAEVVGVDTYELQAVLDERTSAFCEMINGKQFKVERARKKIVEALSATDPNDLKTIQPWPDQSSSSIEELGALTNDELEARGFSVPPFHPLCRTICVLAGYQEESADQADSEIQGQEGDGSSQEGDQSDSPDELPDYTSTDDTFSELGENLDQDQIDYWNQEAGVNPVDVIGLLTDMPGDKVLTDLADKENISVDDGGDISFSVDGNMVPDADSSVNVVYDPKEESINLNYIEITGDSDKAAANYVDKLLDNLVTIALSIGARDLIMNEVSDAALSTYASLGFVPETLADWYSLKTDILADMDDGGTLGYLKGVLSDDQYQTIIDLLNSGDQNAFLALASLPYEMQGRSIADILFEGRSSDLSLDVKDSYAMGQFGS